MPGEATTWGANIALEAIAGRTTQSARTVYLALLRSAPPDNVISTGLVEITSAPSNGYARQAVTWSAPTGDPAITSNTNALSFGPFTVALNTATHAALISSASVGGVVLWTWQLNTPRAAGQGNTITFAIGDLQMGLD